MDKKEAFVEVEQGNLNGGKGNAGEDHGYPDMLEDVSKALVTPKDRDEP